MEVANMRYSLKHYTKYKNSVKWCKKVDAMSENQVIAIYYRMKESGEIQKP